MVPFYPQGNLIIRGLTDSLDLIWAVAATPFDSFLLLFRDQIKLCILWSSSSLWPTPPPFFFLRTMGKPSYLLSCLMSDIAPRSQTQRMVVHYRAMSEECARENKYKKKRGKKNDLGRAVAATAAHTFLGHRKGWPAQSPPSLQDSEWEDAGGTCAASARGCQSRMQWWDFARCQTPKSPARERQGQTDSTFHLNGGQGTA